MITEIELRNFQCHKLKRIQFHPGVNWITGTSDSGKSSIVRAIEWARTNRPRGTGFIRNGAKGCQVTIYTDDDHSVVRKRSSNTNIYSVDGADIEGAGVSVPEPVVQSLRLDDINIQHQHDSHFLLSQTAGEVGRRFNSFVNLGVIDAMIRSLNAKRNKLSNRIANEIDRVNQLAETLERRKSLPNIDGRVAALERLYIDLTTSRGSLTRIQSLYEDSTIQRRAISRLDGMLSEVVPSMERTENVVSVLTTAKRECRNIQQAVGEVGEIQQSLDLSGEADRAAKKLEKLGNTSVELFQSQACLKQITTLLQDWEKSNTAIAELEEDLEREEAWAAENIQGKPCPVCGKEM